MHLGKHEVHLYARRSWATVLLYIAAWGLAALVLVASGWSFG